VPKSRIVVYSLITILALAIDLVSKEVVFHQLGGPYRSTGWLIDGWFKFELHTNLNPGALWGMGQGFALYFAALSVLAFAGINYWLFFRGGARSLWLTVALALVSGGTLGNLYDRVGLHGVVVPGKQEPAQAVRDFLHCQLGTLDWPIFNLADSFLVAGAIMLMLQSLKSEEAPAIVSVGTVRERTEDPA
jgi:signal peptidase II